MLNRLLLQIFVCLASAGFTLYSSVSGQNHLMALRRAIPPLAKEVKALREENHRLEYQIDRFENPVHLIELSRKPEYGHLKYPDLRDIIVLPIPKKEQ